VEKCLVFHQNEVETIKNPSLLQPLSIESHCWEEDSMDFIKGLPKSEGKSVIMVVVEIITEYAHFCALSHPLKSSTISMALVVNNVYVVVMYDLPLYASKGNIPQAHCSKWDPPKRDSKISLTKSPPKSKLEKTL